MKLRGTPTYLPIADSLKRLREIAYQASWKKFVPVSPQYGKQIRDMARPFEGK